MDDGQVMWGRLIIALLLASLVGSCGETSGGLEVADGRNLAADLCETRGRESATALGRVEGLSAVYEVDRLSVVAWQAIPDSPWDNYPGDRLVAICLFDASEITAPAGPPPGAVYDQLMVLVGEDGRVQPDMAVQEGRSRAPNVPEKARRVR
jgi:hypothetical protein